MSIPIVTVSEDQNVVSWKGKEYVATVYGGPHDPCECCPLIFVGCKCRGIPCMPEERADGQRVIFAEDVKGYIYEPCAGDEAHLLSVVGVMATGLCYVYFNGDMMATVRFLGEAVVKLEAAESRRMREDSVHG
jgi:hypothetical protein